MIDQINRTLRADRKMVCQHLQREMYTVCDADRGADHCEPGKAELADLLDPEEINRIDIEEIGDFDHDIAEEHACEHIGDSQHEERRHDDFRQDQNELSRCWKSPLTFPLTRAPPSPAEAGRGVLFSLAPLAGRGSG